MSNPENLAGRPQITVLAGREVPLGGPRAITVHRTLPHLYRSFVGAWCFIDHYGPHEVVDGRGMDVPPTRTVGWPPSAGCSRAMWNIVTPPACTPWCAPVN